MEKLPRTCQRDEENQQRCDEEGSCKTCLNGNHWISTDLSQPTRSQLLEVFTELNQGVKKLLTHDASDKAGPVSTCDPEIKRLLKETSNKLDKFGPALNWKPPSPLLYPLDAVHRLPEVWPSMEVFFTGVESLELLPSIGYSKTDLPWHINGEARYINDDAGHIKDCIADNQRQTREAQKWVRAAWVMSQSEFFRHKSERNISFKDISQASHEAREFSKLLKHFAKECERIWPIGAESPTVREMAFAHSNCEEIYLAVRPFLLVACEGSHFPQDATFASMTKDQQDLVMLVSIGVTNTFSFARGIPESASLSAIECNACERDRIWIEHRRFGAVLVLARIYTSGVFRLLPDTELTKDSLEELIAQRIAAMTSEHLDLGREILKNVRSQLAHES